MAKTKVDYEMIYEYLETKRNNPKMGKTVTAANIANAIGVDRIYGGTMTKLVRDGYLEKCPAAGYYKVVM